MPDSNNYIWTCSFCNHRGKINADGIEDPQRLAELLYQDHAKRAVPGCDWRKNVRIIDPNMRECRELQALLVLEKVS